MENILKKIAILVMLTSALSANLEDHFKKAEGKSDIHKFGNIDFIYMINLDERPEKFDRTVRGLAPYGITPYRFSAVNGWKLDFQVLDDIGVKFEPGMDTGIKGSVYRLENNKEYISHEMIEKPGVTYFSHCMSRGAIGIVLSQLSVLQDAYDSGYETIWVMEDDVEVHSDPKELCELIEKLDQRVGNWDILFTDRDTRNKDGQFVPCTGVSRRPNFKVESPRCFSKVCRISKDFSTKKARFGVYSMIVRRSGMKKILDFYKEYKVFLPFDIDCFYAPGLSIYTCNKSIVAHQLDALSDNGGENYQNKNMLKTSKKNKDEIQN